jgi:hypothetical protein
MGLADDLSQTLTRMESVGVDSGPGQWFMRRNLNGPLTIDLVEPTTDYPYGEKAQRLYLETNTVSGNVTISLPPLTNVTVGLEIVCWKQGAANVCHVEADTNGGYLIARPGGAVSSVSLTTQFSHVHLLHRGSGAWADLAGSDTSLLAGDGDAYSPAGAGSVTLDQSHLVVLVSATGAARTVNLPAAADSRQKQYHIKKTDATANAVTIDPDGSETIDGAATAALSGQYDNVHIYCDGTEWHIL